MVKFSIHIIAANIKPPPLHPPGHALLCDGSVQVGLILSPGALGFECFHIDSCSLPLILRNSLRHKQEL